MWLAKYHGPDALDVINAVFGGRCYRRQLISDARVAVSDGELVAEFDAPGVKRAELRASVESDALTVDAKRGDVSSRVRVPLDASCDVSAASAAFADGVLTVRIPRKRAEARALEIS